MTYDRSRLAMAAAAALLAFCRLACSPLVFAQSISFTRSPATNTVGIPALVDLDDDGWLDSPGALNDGQGNLAPFPITSMAIADLFVSGRPSDLKMADFNGDGCPDLVAQGYSSTNLDTRALLYFNDGTGRFSRDSAFAALIFRGRGEGMTVADFNNDGYLDIFLPYYTLSCAPGGSDAGDANCPNAPHAYLLLNDGHGNFHDVAVAAGVDFSPGSAVAPAGMQPEGVQAVDVNNDGLIDLYVGGRLMINTGIDANGVPHFKDCACGLPAPPAGGLRADEGAKFIDWNNDGLLDLVIHNWNSGPTLYQNIGAPTAPNFAARTETDPLTHHPFFSTGAPNFSPVLFQDSFGINIYDMDGDGKEDIITTGSPNPAINQCSGNPCPVYPDTVFRNTGSGFEQVNAGDISGIAGGGAIGFGDVNRDGKIDIIYGASYFINTSSSANSFVSVEMLGPNGEQNQQGRVIQVQPQIPAGITFTRAVDSGSGYHSQNQYAVLAGTPYAGPHTVKVRYATGIVSFSLNPGQYARTYAPTAQSPSGQVVVYSQPPPPLPSKCQDWLRPMLDLITD